MVKSNHIRGKSEGSEVTLEYYQKKGFSLHSSLLHAEISVFELSGMGACSTPTKLKYKYKYKWEFVERDLQIVQGR